MKSKIFITVLVAVITASGMFAQVHDHSKILKSDTIRVAGKCGMCKSRIEEAAKIKGVSKADWNSSTNLLVLVYDPGVTSTESVQKLIASAGHDTEKFKAEDKVYNSLPGCCKYNRLK
ncbi:MAG TPA: ATPase [Bacteroidales bacterium]|jgi:hypothetical protein|nr:ATPase [Bacteroidales bacterium]